MHIPNSLRIDLIPATQKKVRKLETNMFHDLFNRILHTLFRFHGKLRRGFQVITVHFLRGRGGVFYLKGQNIF